MRQRIDRDSQRLAVAIAASVVGLSLVGVSNANASLVNLPAYPPGGPAYSVSFTPGDSTALPGGVPITVISSITNDSAPSPAILGTLESQIYPDGSGGLEFVYTLTVAANAGDDFDSLTLSSFDPSITTAVGYNNPGSSVDPTSVERNSSNELDWSFESAPLGNGTVGPSQTSDQLIVDTNATAFTAGSGYLQDGIIGDGAITIPVPVSGVPEPASAGLIVLVSGMLLGRRRRA